jgi:cardiolipin synthase
MVIKEQSPYAINTMLAVIFGTDFLDGYIARHFDQVTELGKLIDPIGDRLAVGIVFVLYLYKGWIPWWMGAVILFREVVVSWAAIALGILGVPRFDVTFEGKLATLLLMFSVPFFTVAGSTYNWNVPARVVADSLAVPGAAFSYYAASQYARSARAAWPNRRGVASDA